MRIAKMWVVMLFAAGLGSPAIAKTPITASGQGAGVPYPDQSTPRPIDMGPLITHSGSTPISITMALRLRSANQAESLMDALYTPGNSQFHQFLSADEFAARFAPLQSDVDKVTAQLAAYKLSAVRTSATTLRVTGLPADMERAFAVSLHSYQVAAHGNAPAYTFHAPQSHPSTPSEMSAAIAGIAGLDSRPSFRPMHRNAVKPLAAQRPSASAQATADPLGELTVADFASLYDVTPLYQHAITGKGRTLGIVTLASFTPSDAFAYWKALGLKVSSKRIQVVDIDGGPGAPSDASGSLETTLDVEQSGGIAPGSRIIVYQAPNTSQGFVDAFAAAIESNRVDSLSVSWGEWEWFDDLDNAPVSDPLTGQTVSSLQAFHELFVRAAIQGQSLFSASGDSGAYEMNNDLGCNPETTGKGQTPCTLTLSVDYPASDPAITAAGGTTLPGVQEYCLNSACTPPFYTISLPRERVWGWDYLDGFCKAIGLPDPIACGTFPGGGGGGVSVFFGAPSYQDELAGVQRSQPHQTFIYGGTDYFDLPAHYPGRNVPDISANADPQTGYVVYYTSSSSGGLGAYTFYGGTSFVAPQMNGVTALLGQSLEGRIGLLNYPLYSLAQGRKGYTGSHPSLHAITDGDNWFYRGRNGYSPAAGLGTLDVANFATYLRGLDQ